MHLIRFMCWNKQAYRLKKQDNLTAKLHTLLRIGFLPGFPYLGTLIK